MSKKCKQCGVEKEDSEFYTHKKTGALYAMCKECHKKRCAEYVKNSRKTKKDWPPTPKTGVIS